MPIDTGLCVLFLSSAVPQGAPLDSDGEMCYTSKEEVQAFLAVVRAQAPVTSSSPPPPPPAPPFSTATGGGADGRKRNRWGDGLDAPAAGSRNFFPDSYTPQLDVPDSIRAFGHNDSDVSRMVEKGKHIQWELEQDGTVFDAEHAAALYSYTEEEPTDLYGKLNKACRTPGGQAEKKLKRYRDFLYHMGKASDNLPAFIGEAYRGLNAKLNASSYAVGSTVTWQQFSSASQKQHVVRRFTREEGNSLIGTFFVIQCKTAKGIEEFSAYPEEEEVLLKYNTFFKVTRKAESEGEKKALLSDLAAYDLSNLDVYQLKEL